MAYSNKLPDHKFNLIYDELMGRAEKALINHGPKYKGNLTLNGTGKVKSTSSFYPNPWVKVLNLWTRNNISNIEVYDMLRIDQVSIMVYSMKYDETIE